MAAGLLCFGADPLLLGTFGGINALSSPTDMVLAAIASLVCYYWGMAASLPVPEITDDEEIMDEAEKASDNYAHH